MNKAEMIKTLNNAIAILEGHETDFLKNIGIRQDLKYVKAEMEKSFSLIDIDRKEAIASIIFDYDGSADYESPSEGDCHNIAEEIMGLPLPSPLRTFNQVDRGDAEALASKLVENMDIDEVVSCAIGNLTDSYVNDLELYENDLENEDL